MTFGAAVCLLGIIGMMYIANREIEKERAKYERMRRVCNRLMKNMSK